MRTPSSTADTSVLVTGATGTVGRPLVTALLTMGATVRAVTRDPLAARLPLAAEIVDGDPNRPQTLTDALEGVTALFVNPAAAGEFTGVLLTLAAERGVRRVVLLSSAAVGDELAQKADPDVFWHRLVEETVVNSQLAWTVLRSAEFAAETLARWGPEFRATGVVRDTERQAATAPIHERDLAAVAARVLLSDEHTGATHTLTGPQSLTRRQLARLLADGVRRRVRFEEATRDQAVRNVMAWRQLPEGIAESVVQAQRESTGRPAVVSATVERITGRPALTFAQWVADHTADFR